MFSIHPLSRFESGQTAIRRPKQILEFCFDGDHKLLPLSDECLRYYYPPVFDAPWVSQGTQSRINLSTGFDNWIKADESIDWHLDGLLQTIQAHEEALLAQGKPVNEVRVNADVVAWRGILTKVRLSEQQRMDGSLIEETDHDRTVRLLRRFRIERDLLPGAPILCSPTRVWLTRSAKDTM